MISLRTSSLPGKLPGNCRGLGTSFADGSLFPIRQLCLIESLYLSKTAKLLGKKYSRGNFTRISLQISHWNSPKELRPSPCLHRLNHRISMNCANTSTPFLIAATLTGMNLVKSWWHLPLILPSFPLLFFQSLEIHPPLESAFLICFSVIHYCLTPKQSASPQFIRSIWLSPICFQVREDLKDSIFGLLNSKNDSFHNGLAASIS
jgi:hypothetical protein